MTRTTRLAVLAACVVVGLLAAWYAGSRFPAAGPVPAAGSVRLGPEPGEPVGGYLARLPAALPAPGAVVPALVQFAAELAVGPAAARVAGAGMPAEVAVFHVPLPRVQTALRFAPLDPAVPAAAALAAAREQARFGAAADADRRSGRPRAVAAAEATALADPGCPCVLAVVVRGDRAGLAALAAAPGVRAVHAAPQGTAVRELALAPLLPAQVQRADPLPDDGPVPG